MAALPNKLTFEGIDYELIRTDSTTFVMAFPINGPIMNLNLYEKKAAGDQYVCTYFGLRLNDNYYAFKPIKL